MQAMENRSIQNSQVHLTHEISATVDKLNALIEAAVKQHLPLSMALHTERRCNAGLDYDVIGYDLRFTQSM